MDLKEQIAALKSGASMYRSTEEIPIQALTLITTHSLHHRLRYWLHLNSSVPGQNAVTTQQLLRTVTSDSSNSIDATETEEYFILYFSLCQFSSRCSVNQCAQQTGHFHQAFNNVPLVEKSALHGHTEKDIISVKIAEISNKA